ncbi:MAG TPA: protein kinase, partial [Thermoanaerobaculia bacterium]|nr:protein kinase [Thermoanaerobaculia bacterium]
MTIPSGTRLGPYEVLAPIGAGGMGEVYRARDTRLDREVAVKVLPGSVASDPEAVARFEREARAVAALSHPNILSLHDFGAQAGVVFAVMELLEGRTLGTLLEEGPLPPRRAGAIAREVAEGLAAAHSKGIVHRDLKPENVFVSKEGHAKILDFGLARDLRVSAKEDTSAPTERPLTEPGAVMGTVGYMSPEQVRGLPLDHRSDVFSFGAVLYEMLSGSRAFRKPTSAETMTAILKEEPPELASSSGLASSLDQVARRCLEKNPESRFQDTRDLVFAIEMASERATRSGAQAAASGRKLPLGILAAALAVLLASVGAWLAASKSRPQEPPRFERLTFRRGYVRGARYTPDGRSVVYAAAWDGGPLKLFLKAPESSDALPIDLPSANVLAVSAAGELAIALDCRFSHNGVCRGTLARVPLTGGTPREIAEGVEHADFAKDGELAIVRDLPEAGKSRLEFPSGKVLYETDGHVSFPRVSPDGKRIAFFDHQLRGDDAGFVAVVDLAGKKQVLTTRFTTGRGLAWSPSGEEIWFTAAD